MCHYYHPHPPRYTFLLRKGNWSNQSISFYRKVYKHFIWQWLVLSQKRSKGRWLREGAPRFRKIPINGSRCLLASSEAGGSGIGHYPVDSRWRIYLTLVHLLYKLCLSIAYMLLYVWCLMLEEHFFPPLMHWFAVGSTSFVSDDWIYAQFKRLHRRLHSEVVQLVRRITILQCWVELLLVNLSLAPSKMLCRALIKILNLPAANVP